VVNVNIKDLENYISRPVKVCIHGELNEDIAPPVNKTIYKLSLCPDQTHLRIYFDPISFFAVPLGSTVKIEEKQWSAYDKDCGLYYVIKRG
jgi:hypothetical protein